MAVVPTGWRLAASRWSGPLAVVVAVLVTNLPGLIGLVHPNPLADLAMASPTVASGYLPGHWFTDLNIGWTAQALGHRAALDWLHLKVPWWNPYEGVGSPLAAEMQAAAFFPPVLLFALSNGALLFHVALEIGAGLATYFLVRELGMARYVATVGGVIFALNGTFSWLANAPMNPVPMLPLLILGIERCYRRPERSSGWILVALALSLSLYAGFPEIAYLDGIMGLAWALFRFAGTPSGTRAKLAGRLALGGLAGLLLSLPIAIPFAEYLPHAYVGVHNGSAVGFTHVVFSNLPIFGLPYIYGPARVGLAGISSLGSYFGPAGGFLTASSLAAAVIGLLGSRRDRGLRLFLAITAGVVVLWNFGVPPFSRLATVLPYMSHIWAVRYSPPMWEMAVTLLACYGLEALGHDARARSSSIAAGLAAVVVGALVVLVEARPLIDKIARAHRLVPVRTYATEMIVWALVVTVAVSALGALGRRRLTVGLVAGVLAVDAMVMGAIPQLSAPKSYTVDLAPVAYLDAHLGTGRYFSFWAYHSDYGSYFGLAQLNETDLPVPTAFANEITSVLGPNSNPIRFDGLQVRKQSGPSAVDQALAHLSAYERLGVRYFVTLDSRPVLGLGPAYPRGLRLVFRDSFASIFALPHPVAYFTTVQGHCHLVPNGRDNVTATCSAPALLVRSELDLPGWAATVNGQPVPVLDYRRLVTAVRLPEGKSVVAFTYAPPHIDLALAGFLAGAAMIFGEPIVRRRRARRRQPAAEAAAS